MTTEIPRVGVAKSALARAAKAVYKDPRNAELSAQHEQARMVLAEANMAAYIKRTLAVSPALTEDQIQRLERLIRSEGERP
jgi:deoxyinosine 3'endonuclease (endonuclease V)